MKQSEPFYVKQSTIPAKKPSMQWQRIEKRTPAPVEKTASLDSSEPEFLPEFQTAV